MSVDYIINYTTNKLHKDIKGFYFISNIFILFNVKFNILPIYMYS